MSAAALAPWIHIDPALWFDPKTYSGCKRRPRNQPPRLVVGHWTGGEAGTRRFDDDGQRVADVLRHRDPPLSIHFVIGGDGTTWQMADPESTWCLHASAVNAWSIGIEVVNAGLVAGEQPGRPRSTVIINDRKSLAFYEPQFASWRRLCELLCDRYAIPMEVPGRLDVATGKIDLYDGRIPQHRLRRFSGVIEHLHAGSKKPDAGLQLVGDLVVRSGFAIAEV